MVHNRAPGGQLAPGPQATSGRTCHALVAEVLDPASGRGMQQQHQAATTAPGGAVGGGQTSRCGLARVGLYGSHVRNGSRRAGSGPDLGRIWAGAKGGPAGGLNMIYRLSKLSTQRQDQASTWWRCHHTTAAAVAGDPGMHAVASQCRACMAHVVRPPWVPPTAFFSLADSSSYEVPNFCTTAQHSTGRSGDSTAQHSTVARHGQQVKIARRTMRCRTSVLGRSTALHGTAQNGMGQHSSNARSAGGDYRYHRTFSRMACRHLPGHWPRPCPAIHQAGDDRSCGKNGGGWGGQVGSCQKLSPSCHRRLFFQVA